MGQITIYLDEATERVLQIEAEAAHLSRSQWVARIIRKQVAAAWPEDVVRLAGAWKDLPEAEELRKGHAKDTPREPL